MGASAPFRSTDRRIYRVTKSYISANPMCSDCGCDIFYCFLKAEQDENEKRKMRIKHLIFHLVHVLVPSIKMRLLSWLDAIKGSNKKKATFNEILFSFCPQPSPHRPKKGSKLIPNIQARNYFILS
jgi:hypothetical protein